MIYNLSDSLQREQFKRRAEVLLKKQGFVELSEHRFSQERTLKQNSYLHLILGYFGAFIGLRRDVVKEEIFKRRVNPDLFLKESDDSELGKFVYTRSTKDLTVEEMSMAIDRFRNFSAMELGLYIPSSDEKDWIESMEIEVKRNERYL